MNFSGILPLLFVGVVLYLMLKGGGGCCGGHGHNHRRGKNRGQDN